MDTKDTIEQDCDDQKSCRVCRAALYAGLTLTGMAAALLFWIWAYAFAPGPQNVRSKPISIIIPPQTSLQGVQNILAQQGLLQNDYRFNLLARLMGITRSLKAGEYSFSKAATPYTILTALEKGTVVKQSVTIPEGVNIYQVADILARFDWLDKDKLLEAFNNPGPLEAFDIKGVQSLEGYLFPDTYSLTREQSPESIVRMMLKRFNRVLGEINFTGNNRTGLTLHEILTIASIVEKETAIHEEKPLIAAVFGNRLKKGMRLQADPTVIYGINQFNGDITFKDLKTPSPYNTYIIKGLPPGPICNPGKSSIEAVVNMNTPQGPDNAKPDGTPYEYIYFVSKNDGSHFFSKTLAEHNKAVTKYQKQNKR